MQSTDEIERSFWLPLKKIKKTEPFSKELFPKKSDRAKLLL